MNKPVQILLLFAFLPMLGMAREETLEERKQRIVRKYLRENATITQSDLVVPSDLPVEDEQVTDSEQFKDAEVDLQRHEGAATPIMPPQQRPVPRANSNWLLDDMDEEADGSNPYADPYSSGSIDSGDNLWSAWDGTSSRDTQTTRQNRNTDSYRNDPYSRQDSNRGIFGGRQQQEYSTGGQQGSGFGASSRTGIFGREQQSGQSGYSSGLNLQGSQTRTYGSDPSEGMLSTPLPQIDSSSRKDEQRRSSQGYQPYKSPYEQQREERRQQQRGTVPKPEQPEFKRPDSYQQWKERNKTWDPTQDDAYISEMMKKNKR